MKYIYTQTKHSTYMKLHSTIKQEYNTSYIYIYTKIQQNITKLYIQLKYKYIYVCIYIQNYIQLFSVQPPAAFVDCFNTSPPHRLSKLVIDRIQFHDGLLDLLQHEIVQGQLPSPNKKIGTWMPLICLYLAYTIFYHLGYCFFLT